MSLNVLNDMDKKPVKIDKAEIKKAKTEKEKQVRDNETVKK